MNWIANFSLRTKIVLIVGSACLLCATVAIGGFKYFNLKELESGIVNKQRTIHSQLAAATEYVAKQGGLKDVVQKYQTKYKSADQLTETERVEILNQVPIYASLVIGKKNAAIDKYEFRVFSDEPRRKENLASASELEVFQKFASDPTLNELVKNGDDTITMYRPVRLSEAQGCLMCHGSPETSPWKNGTDILGYKMENWKDGKLHGIFAVSQKPTEVAKASAGDGLISPSGWLIIAILFGALIAILFAAFFMRGPISSLNSVAQAISEVSTQVNTYSQKVASSSQTLSEASTQQAASLEQTAASLEQISAMIAKASDNANSTAESSNESQQKSTDGRASVDQMLASMEDISQSNEAIMNQVNESNQQMSEIVKVIQEIGNRTKVINEIVFQTKLLSFNASVEAARAGEHGKGFAVVAEEVGSLAQMSGNAAKEITDMLDSSIVKVEQIVNSTKTQVAALVHSGKEKVESGIQIAQQCSKALDEIVANVTEVARLSQEISHATKEQSQGVAEINKAMNQLDSVTQQNAATSEETAGAAKQLSAQSEALKAAVEGLVATVQGSGSHVGIGELNSSYNAPATSVSESNARKSNWDGQSQKLKKDRSLNFSKTSSQLNNANNANSSNKERKNIINSSSDKKLGAVVAINKYKKSNPDSSSSNNSSTDNGTAATENVFKNAAGDDSTPSRDSSGFE